LLLCFFPAVLRFWNQGFTLARQVLYLFEPHLHPFFALTIFETGSWFLSWLAGPWSSCLCHPDIARMTSMCHHTQPFLLRWSLVNLLPGLASNCDSPNLSLPGARIIGLLFLVLVLFFDRVFLCSSGWPWSQNPPASASWLLGLQVCITVLGLIVTALSWLLENFKLHMKHYISNNDQSWTCFRCLTKLVWCACLLVPAIQETDVRGSLESRSLRPPWTM
jgi:hypothetical protein